MWEAALSHERSIDRWWKAITSPEARMAACERVIGYADARTLEHVIRLMVTEPDSVLRQHQPGRESLRRLLEAGMAAPDITLQSKTIDLVRRIPVETNRWQAFAFDESLDRRLGEMALDESFGAEEIARYVGRLHSSAALRVVLADYTERQSERAFDALHTIALAAGGLPDFVPGSLRLRIAADAIWPQLTANPANLGRVLIASMLAGFAGILVHFYLVIYAPSFLDADRLLIALERALISGPFLGITIFVVRLLARRLSAPSRAAGFTVSLVAGSLGASLTLFIVDYLFLKNGSGGWAIMAGGLLLSLGFAIAASLPRPSWPVRGLLSAVGVWLGIVGSWMLYLFTGSSPIFYYDELWPLAQVFLSAGAVALSVGLVAQVVDLTQ
jgi:hypothetical protein